MGVDEYAIMGWKEGVDGKVGSLAVMTVFLMLSHCRECTWWHVTGIRKGAL